MSFDVLRLVIVDVSNFIAGLRCRVDQLVDLGMKRLCIPMGGALNEQGDVQRGHSCRRVPVESLRLNDQPCDGKQERCGKGGRVRDGHAGNRQKTSKGVGYGDVGDS